MRVLLKQLFGKPHMIARTAAALLANVVIALGIALLRWAQLGNDPFSAMMMAIHAYLPLDYGTFCLLANLVSPMGAAEAVFGTLATLMSCLCIAVIGKEGRERGWGHCIAACCMPVLWNGLIIGCVLALTGEYTLVMFPVTALMFGGMVALGEAAVMFILGLPLLRWLPGSRVMKQLSEKLDIGE